MNALAKAGLDAAIRGIVKSSTEATAIAMGNWGLGYLCGLRVANLITDYEEQECILQLRSVQTATCEMMEAIRRAHGRSVA